MQLVLLILIVDAFISLFLIFGVDLVAADEPPPPFLAEWGYKGDADGQFGGPSRIAVDSTGYIYVADTINHRIQKFTSEGESILQWGGGQTNYNGEFNGPWGVAVASDGSVYVADTNNHRIQKFTVGPYGDAVACSLEANTANSAPASRPHTE